MTGFASWTTGLNGATIVGGSLGLSTTLARQRQHNSDSYTLASGQIRSFAALI